jgi:hypothetical protein
VTASLWQIVSGSTASSPDIDVLYIYIYINTRVSPDLITRAYLNAKFCQNLKATGEELSEIVSGSTPSPADTGVVHVLKHSRNPRERCAESLKGIGPELSEQRGE